ncbi:hypothetical protein FRACYDRAFT_246756 [Fragilariopsis cylindrus CCMP1102]|uniref:Uncharacterized protein n=1 Tax=Fragilariopsis cylindrus CCMP1102 TaxID=635003 RepID=A0A1E7EY43_9STRA|nr:hypothetical protein FRACYDRAFT_246756 [Fragilariopsis cylindrus CCMP1102]|eukprot:OEU10881.1 hypothetical protein FRACYDRAFT_246756 [Fragilariopsis cylindrus CCMP1102]
MKSSFISTSRWENKEKHNDTALPMSSSSDHRVTYSPQSIELDSESDPESSELESELESDLESDWASSDGEEVSYFASKMTIPSKQQNTAALLRLHSTSTLSTSTAQRQQKFSTTSSRLSIPPPPPLTPRHSSLPSLSTQTQITSSTNKNHQWRASTSSPTPIKVNNNRKKNKKKKKEKKKEKKKKNVNWNKNVHVVIIPNLNQYTRTEKLDTYYSPNDYTEIENECDLTSSPCRLFLKYSKLLPSGFCSRGLESWTIDGEEWKEYRVELVIETVWQAQMDTLALDKSKSKNRGISVSGVGGDVCGGGGVGVGRGDDDKTSISSSNNNNVGAGSSLDYYCNTTSWNRSSWNCEDEYIRQQSTKESLPSILRAQQIALQDEKDIQSYLNSVRSLEKSRKRYITTSSSSRSITRTKTKMTTRIAKSSVGISSSSSIGSSPTSLAVVTTKTKTMLKSIMKQSSRNKPTRSNSDPSFSSHIQRVMKPTRRTTATTSNPTSKGPPRRPERFASPTSSKPSINFGIMDDDNNNSNDNNKNSINNAVSRGEGGGETHSLRNVADIDGDNSNSNNNSKSTRNSNSNSNSNSSRCSIRSNGSNVVENNNKMKKIHFIPKSKTKIPTSPVSSLYGSISSLSNGDNNNDKHTKISRFAIKMNHKISHMKGFHRTTPAGSGAQTFT